ncbi:MAG: DNA polymerase III subunit chi [Spongiibacteraceae bacterium]
MTKLDFYILQDRDSDNALHYACRIIEKACRAGHHVVVQTDDEPAAASFDDLLWRFRPESFVPHSRDAADNSPVHINHGDVRHQHCDILLNLGSAIPPCFSQFKRVVEIVCQDEAWLASSRQRYSFYKDRGYPITTHNL